MTDDAPVIDTRDMIYAHDALRRALADAPGQISSVDDGDTERAGTVGGYLGEVLWLLSAHHNAEDELLYPLLAERAPDAGELFARMEAQHGAVHTHLETAQRAAERWAASASAEDAAELEAASNALFDVLAGHLTEEEVEVLPIASRRMTQAEWGALPGHTLAHYTGSTVWIPFGLVLEAMPEDFAARVLANVPPPVAAMWFGAGGDAFKREMASVRSDAS